MYVFCPKILKTKWNNVAKEFGLHLNVFSYSEIISSSKEFTKHGLLERKDAVVKNNLNKSRDTHAASKFLLKQSNKKRGIMCVFDEMQSIKNR